MHKCSVLAIEDFRKVIEGKQNSVRHMISAAEQELINENRRKLKSIIKTVIFLGQQNIHFRGHRDDSQHLDTVTNAGNFQALLDFRVEHGDKVLEDI